MHIAIFGSGAVGGYFGGRLAEAGTRVTFIARGDTLQALKNNGLQIITPSGKKKIINAVATGSPEKVGQVDAIILGVKAWQVPEAAGHLHGMIGDQTVVLPLQNGVEAPEQLSKVLGAQHVLGGTCRIICKVNAPGQIEHVGADPYIALGELNNRKSNRVLSLLREFENAGIHAEIPANIHRDIWEKFAYITPISGIGAVRRVPFGVIRSTPETRTMYQQAVQEVITVAKAVNIDLPAELPEQLLDLLDNLPENGTASMQRDIIAGRPSELEAQNGAVFRLGVQNHVDVPVNQFIYESLKPLENIARAHS